MEPRVRNRLCARESLKGEAAAARHACQGIREWTLQPPQEVTQRRFNLGFKASKVKTQDHEHQKAPQVLAPRGFNVEEVIGRLSAPSGAGGCFVRPETVRLATASSAPNPQP